MTWCAADGMTCRMADVGVRDRLVWHSVGEEVPRKYRQGKV